VIAKETRKGRRAAAFFQNSRPIMSNPEQSESLSNQIALYNEEPETLTREEALSYWKACAWLRIPCRMWQAGARVKMTDKIARNVRTEELTNKDKRIIAQLLCHKADARSWTIFEDFDFIRVSVDYGKPNESEPSLLVDNIAVTPEIFTALGQVAARWQVQSVDVDDRLDELLSMDEALISAATRAFERRIREKKLCELETRH
jgi:hypothetical protein